MKGGGNRRSYLRVKPASLHGEISIVSADSQNTNTRCAFVDISDIGTGGLRFISHLNIPENRKIVLKIVLRKDGDAVILYGLILRKSFLGPLMYEYAVCFTEMDKKQHSQLASLLGAIKLEQAYLQQF